MDRDIEMVLQKDYVLQLHSINMMKNKFNMIII